MIDLNYTWVDMECPSCGYQDEVQLVDVKTEKTVYCHNCKESIMLLDNEASVHHGIEAINSSINKLEKAFKIFGK